jgi:hypothetical protein
MQLKRVLIALAHPPAESFSKSRIAAMAAPSRDELQGVAEIMQGRSIILKRRDSERLLGEEMRSCTPFPGRLLGPDGQEHPCFATGASTHFIAVRSSYLPAIGERVVIYIEGWDRFAGKVARLFSGGFAMHFEATQRRREKVAARLDWFSKEPARIEVALRQDKRIAPRNRWSTLAFHGKVYDCEIENISRKGAMLKTQAKVPLGARVELESGRKAEVVREIEQGFAVQFMRLLPIEIFDENIRL